MIAIIIDRRIIHRQPLKNGKKKKKKKKKNNNRKEMKQKFGTMIPKKISSKRDVRREVRCCAPLATGTVPQSACNGLRTPNGLNLPAIIRAKGLH